MRLLGLILTLGLALSCSKAEEAGSEERTSEIVFEAGSCTTDGVTLPYRYARICPGEESSPVVVLVLHGGPLKGSDNQMQLEETATRKICEYLSRKGINSILLAPHCPEKNARGRQMNWVQLTSVLKMLTDQYTVGNGTKAYIFGASIGGAGTWAMLSEYPGLFAGAMPCASDPSGCDAANAAKTRIYTVMGTEDTWAPLEKTDMQSFLDEVSRCGGIWRFDIGEGWDHETTCRESFTEERLDWVFCL